MEYEQKLLALLIQNKEIAVKCLELGIKSQLFESPEYAMFFKTVMYYFNKYRQLPSEDTYLKFLSLIKLDEDMKSKLPVVYFDVSGLTVSETFDFIVEYLLKYYKTRKIKEVLRQNLDGLQPDSIEDTSTQITSSISQIRSFGSLEGREGDFRHCGAEALERYYKAKTDGFVGLKYGYPSLDIRTGGQSAGELWITLGYMKAGKSTMLLNMANNVWKQGKNVVYFSAEVSKAVLERRLTAMNLGLSITAIKQGSLVSEEEQRMKELYTNIETAPSSLYIVDRGGMTTEYIQAKVRELKSVMPIDLVVVDYLGICKTNNARGSTKDHEYFGQLAWDLRDIAKTEQVPVLTAHQSNKEKGISKSLDVGRHCDLMFSISVKDENQILCGSELVDLEATIMLTRDSAAGKFPLEASYSKGIIVEPIASASNLIGNTLDDDEMDSDII